MNRIFTIIFLLCISSAYGQGSWTTLRAPDATRYDDIYFINDQVGWTAGGWLMKVHKTIDGGKTWNESGTLSKYLRSIEFFDENIGLCGSLQSSLFRTTDGGATWTDVAVDIVPRPGGVCGLAIADENTVYGVGIWSEPAFVIKSVDKGLTWTYTDMSAYANSLIDVYFLDADHGFVTGSISDEVGGVVLYTDDGGQTWTEKFRTNHVSDRIWKIQTPDNKHFFGSIESFVQDGKTTRMIRSDDYGQTWEMKQVDPQYFYCQTVGFIDSLRGWTGGNNQLFETKDGGDSWTKVSVGSTYNRFFKISENIAYLTGSKIYRFDRLLDPNPGPGPGPDPGPVTGSPELDVYDPVHTVHVSPNPTTGKANVHVNFGCSTSAHIYLYGIHGKKLEKIFSGQVEKGERTFAIDLSGQPRQTFVVIVKTNEEIESVKIVKD